MRVPLTLILIASYLTAPVMAMPHAHGERFVGDSPAHDLRPHVHVGSSPVHEHPHGHHHHDHDHHDDDDHASHHDHDPSKVPGERVAGAVTELTATDDIPVVLPRDSHDADAVYVSSLVGAGRNPLDTAPVISDSVVAAVVETYVPSAGLDSRARYWHPPSGARDGTDLYLKLRNLRI